MRSAPVAQSPQAVAGFFDQHGFELLQRVAKAFASSELVPKQYQGNIANCMIAMDMANRIGANPLMAMQNLYVVHGTPSWSSKFLVATINACGRFSSLRYEWKGEPGSEDFGCRAWAIERESGERLDGIWVTWKMVNAEGWASKNGSKWKTMPDQMFVYRAAAFWQRAYAPELGMGLMTTEEAHDVIDINVDGTVASVTSESLRTRNITPEAKPETVDQGTGEIIESETSAAAATSTTVESTDEAQFKKISDSLEKATDLDVLDVAADLIGTISDKTLREELSAMYQHRRDQLENPPAAEAAAPSRARRERSNSASME